MENTVKIMPHNFTRSFDFTVTAREPSDIVYDRAIILGCIIYGPHTFATIPVGGTDPYYEGDWSEYL